MLRRFHAVILAASLALPALAAVPAQARDHIMVNNKCDSRLRIFVRAYKDGDYYNAGWWVFAPKEDGQILAQDGVKVIHNHDKHLYFYAEGIGNDLTWNEGPTTTTFEGDKYELSLTDNTNDENDTPINLTCSKK